MLKRILIAALSASLTLFSPVSAMADDPITVASSTQDGFARWVASFRKRALKAGIKASTFDAAYKGVEFKPRIIELDQFQPEFTKTLWEYLDSAVPATRVREGQRARRKYGKTLDAIERAYGVDVRVLLGIWGIETNYGAFMGGTGVIEGLSTLAYEGRRRAWAERELIGALTILQSGDTSPGNMEGSWAGAMGHTQFMPTSYLAYAQDFNGDGKRDVWSKDPTDALASAANYLRIYGWKKGQPWGVEVKLPADFDYSLANISPGLPMSYWMSKGVRLTNGQQVPNYGKSGLWTPAGYGGPAFLVFPNFFVIKRYNNAPTYVTAVGHLGDRIYGGEPFKAKWPKDNRPLNRDETRLLQKLLTQNGYDTQGVDGLIGPNSMAAIRAFQRNQKLVPDGTPTLDLLKRLQ